MTIVWILSYLAVYFLGLFTLAAFWCYVIMEQHKIEARKKAARKKALGRILDQPDRVTPDSK